MASLWNYVTRLTSRRRQDPQQSLPAPDIVSEQDFAMLVAAEAVADDAATARKLPQVGRIAEELGQAVAAVGLAEGSEAEQVTDAAYPAVIAGGDGLAAQPDTRALLPVPKARTPRRQNNKDEQAVAQHPLASAPTVIPQAIGLDDEIKLLRRALIGKLRLQNAQLKTMLERFDR